MLVLASIHIIRTAIKRAKSEGSVSNLSTASRLKRAKSEGSVSTASTAASTPRVVGGTAGSVAGSVHGGSAHGGDWVLLYRRPREQPAFAPAEALEHLACSSRRSSPSRCCTARARSSSP